ncbi:MAG TPA: tripartite tricarboxylate transporter substrate binding protein [Burkholderiales bacterium]|nr:tripartite tricarboxylate transporter substrate binding protein [Burkholderiales bacterium]
MNRLWAVLLAVASAAASAAACAQDYPARPVTVIVPFSTGSASDVIARIVLERMSATAAQRYVIDNRPAAGGAVGTAAAAKAAPDGYTLLMGASGPLVVAKVLQPGLAYEAERDFDPISLYGRLPNVIVVSTKLPIKSLDELVEYLKRKPGVGYGSVGNGSSQHLAGALFEQLANVQMTHVPYRVTSQLQSDLIGGEVPVSFQLLPNVISALKAGQVRALAVANGSRLAALPDVPTAAELGVKGYESSAWFGFVAPRGTPRPIVEKLNGEVLAALADPALRARFVEFGAEPVTSTSGEFGRFIASEVAKWRGIIAKAGIKADP